MVAWFALLTALYNNADMVVGQDSDMMNVTMTPLSNITSCNMRLRTRLVMSDQPNSVDGVMIVCTRCEPNQRLRFSVSVDRQPSRTVCVKVGNEYPGARVGHGSLLTDPTPPDSTHQLVDPTRPTHHRLKSETRPDPTHSYS